jgi:hypothetical protein
MTTALIATQCDKAIAITMAAIPACFLPVVRHVSRVGGAELGYV